MEEKEMSIAKQILLEELDEQGHLEQVEDVIFWALEFYVKNFDQPTWGRTIAYSIKERILEAKNKALGKEETE